MEKKQSLLRWVVCVGVVFAIAASTAPVVSVRITALDASAYPQVKVYFSAWDVNGVPLDDLRASDLVIEQGGGMQPAIDSLQKANEMPLSVALVLDVSGSMKGQPLQDAKNAANRFLEKLSTEDQVALIAFSGRVETDINAVDPDKEIRFSKDLTGAFTLIEKLSASGGTEVYNALEKAVGWTAQLPAGHRAVLLLTDGRNDPPDVGDPESAIALAREHSIPVFAIGLGQEIDAEYLARLTSQTGGYFSKAPTSSELSALFSNMASLFKSNYQVSYTAADASASGSQDVILRVETAGGSGTAQAAFVLPAAAQQASDVQPSNSAETEAVMPVEIAEDAATQPKAGSLLPLWVVIGLVVVFASSALAVLRARARKRQGVERCAACGHELSAPGACPICKSSERIRTHRD